MSTFDTPLDCDGVAATLADYLDDDAPDALRAAVELHASSCPSCGQLLADLAAIRHDAAALPLLVPSRDLWGGIAERIDARVVPLESPRAARVAALRRSWLRPALAAAALVTITAGVTHYMTRAALSPVAASTQVASSVSSAPAASATPAATPNLDSVSSAASTTTGSALAATTPASTRPAPSRTESPITPRATSSARLASTAPQPNGVDPLYAGEIRTLRKIVRERRTQLDPATVAVLEQSLAVIDSAIAQSRAALAKDPASGFLATQLNRSLDKKVELLRTVASLPART